MSRFPICCILLLFTLFSCHKKDVYGPQGPQGPTGPTGTTSVQKGNIQGRILLYDIFGNPVTDNSGVTVSLDSTNPVVSAQTAIDGSFTIDSVHEGSYNITVQKQGYGTMHYYSFANPGAATAAQTGDLSLGEQMPSQYDIKQLIVDTGSNTYGNYLSFTVILAHPQTVTNPVLIYFNDAPGVGNTANKYVFWTTFYQQNDTTLIYSPYDYPLAAASDKLYNADSLYLSAAIDNSRQFTYKDQQGNQVYPDAGQPSPQVIVNNSLHKY